MRMYWKTSDEPPKLYVETEHAKFVPYNSLPAAIARLSAPDHVIPSVTPGQGSSLSGSLGYATMQKLLARGYVLVNENTVTG